MTSVHANRHEYIVVVHRAAEGGYWIEVPALPGCFAQGETFEEVLTEAREAIGSHLIALQADGQSLIPEETMIATVALEEHVG